METIIIAFALAAGGGGTFILLACLAGKRATLFDGLKIEQELKARKKELERRRLEESKKASKRIATVGGALGD